MSKLAKLVNYPVFAVVVAIVTIVFAIFCNTFFDKWEFIRSDGGGYYIYLPAIAIDRDISLNTTILRVADLHGEDAHIGKEYFGLRYVSDNTWIDKYPVGIALVEAPFFVAADTLTVISGGVRDGYSPLYQWGVALAAMCYLQIGLFASYKVLEARFGKKLSLILLSIFLLGTSLLFYTSYESSMSHVFSFAFISLSIWLLDRYLHKPSLKLLIGIGLTVVIAGVIRNVNIAFGIIPLFLMVKEAKPAKRLGLFLKTLLIWGVIALIVFIPQFLYWYTTTGKIIAYGYQGETFNLLQPHLFEHLFGIASNGLFFWHPLLLLIIPGAYFWIKSKDRMAIPSLIYLVVLIYVLSCWWAYWFGYSFGMRPYVDYYLIFMLPIGYLLQSLEKRKTLLRIIAIIIIGALCLLNMIQLNNYCRGIVAGHNNNPEVYWQNFANPQLSGLFD